MPGWSHEIANEFLLLAGGESRAFNQMQLQKLVYIAHGWCLASFGQPLTADRPEAWEFGPVYTRISDAFARYGTQKITALIHRDIGIILPSAPIPKMSVGFLLSIAALGMKIVASTETVGSSVVTKLHRKDG